LTHGGSNRTRTRQALEARVRRLVDRSMRSEDLGERNRIEAEIRAANLALSHYKAALALEESLKEDD